MSGTARIGPRRLLAAAAALAVGAAVWAGWGFRAPRPETPTVPAAADPFPIPALSDSPFLNTRPEARYVGEDVQDQRAGPGRHHVLLVHRGDLLGDRPAAVPYRQQRGEAGAVGRQRRRALVRRQGLLVRHRAGPARYLP